MRLKNKAILEAIMADGERSMYQLAREHGVTPGVVFGVKFRAGLCSKKTDTTLIRVKLPPTVIAKLRRVARAARMTNTAYIIKLIEGQHES